MNNSDYNYQNSITQVIKQPTRITEISETLIDVILASSTSLIREAKVVPAPFRKKLRLVF